MSECPQSGKRTFVRGMLLPILLSAAFVIPAALRAQWSPLPYVNNLICGADGDQKNHDVVTDGRGGLIVVWEDERSPVAGADIYAQRITASGATVWGAGGVPVCGFLGMQRRPRAVSDGSGGVIVAWDDTRNGDFDIYVQRLDSSGQNAWAPNGIHICTSPWAQNYPVIAKDGAGGAFVIWQDARSTGFAVYAQRVSGSGERLWTENGINVCPVTPSAVLPHAVSDDKGGVIVVWEDARDPGNGGDLYAQRINGIGQLAWTAGGKPVCTAPLSQKNPRITWDGGVAVCAWQDGRGGPGNSDIYAQRLDSNGLALWLQNGVAVCVAQNDQTAPAVIPDETGGTIVAWRDSRFSYSPRVFVQSINRQGVQIWQANGIDVCPSAQGVEQYGLARDGAGGAVLAWHDARGGSLNSNIYGQRISWGGLRMWDVSGALVCTANGNQDNPMLLYAGGPGYFAVWRDFRDDNAGSDVYASFIDLNGAITPVDLLHFSASVESSRVLLRWKTASERSNAGFHVLRSYDSFVWDEIGFAAGDPAGIDGREYRFEDAAPVSSSRREVYYRLRQLDIDGALNDLPVIKVLLGPQEGAGVSTAWPNPTSAVVHLSIQLNETSGVSCALFNTAGRFVGMLFERNALEAGSHIFPLPVGDLTPGAYYLVVESARRLEAHLLNIKR